VLDKLYARISSVRLRPHLLTYAEAIFKGAASRILHQAVQSPEETAPVHNLRVRHSLQRCCYVSGIV
jgi:hypothetical protein